MVTGVRAIAAAVLDPELPQLTIDELGILRDAHAEGGRAVVTITPTYTACPALETIRADIAAALRDAGFTEIDVHTVFAPAWSSDWITESGRAKLAKAGIAPPGAMNEPSAPPGAMNGPSAPPGAAPAGTRTLPLLPPSVPRCPRCDSADVEQLSRFGPTACLALWRCRGCAEPFEYFKSHLSCGQKHVAAETLSGPSRC